jgi:hypothetical protein
LSQVYSGLFDEITCLVEADPVALRITHSLANREVIGLTGVTVLCWTPETIEHFLFVLWDCQNVS